MEEKKLEKGKILNTILEAIGNAPMVRLNRIPKSEGLECEILVKCEFLNPTGSHKDRMALGIIENAEKEGKIKPGGTIVEATSGNAGLAFAFVAAVKGYKAVLAAIAKTSSEKVDLMRGLGADVVKAKPGASSKGPESVFALAQGIAAKTPNSFYASQFANKANPQSHYIATAQEIYDECDGKLDYFFMSAGTGGMITGVGHKFREILPKTKIIGCDPIGSQIADPTAKYQSYKVEGVGYDFVPENCDKSVVSEWVYFGDKEAFRYAGRLMKEEGLMVGGSAGGNLACAIEYAKKHKLNKNHRLVVVLPDTARNYLSKHVSKEWLFENHFINEDEYRRITMEESLLPEKRKGDDIKLSDLKTCRKIMCVKMEAKINEIWELSMENEILIVNESGMVKDNNFKGLITCKDLQSVISTGKLNGKDKIGTMLKTDFNLFNDNLKVSTASKLLDSREYLLFKKETDGEVYMVKPQDIMKILEIH